MLIKKSPYRLIVDIRTTCPKEGAIPKEKREIIEIGAVIFKVGSLEIVDEFNRFIRPLHNPTLTTTFCKEITTITQEDIDSAMGFKEVLEDFKKWHTPYYRDFCYFYSWGEHVKYQFQLESKLHGVEYPFFIKSPKPFSRESQIYDGYVNFQQKFATEQDVEPCSLDEALAYMNIESKGSYNRGIDNARNMIPLLSACSSCVCKKIVSMFISYPLKS